MPQVSFVIRAAIAGEAGTLRGQIEHVPSGATRHFRDQAELLAFITTYLEPRLEPGALPERPPQSGERPMFPFLRRRQPRNEPAPASASEAAVSPGETPPGDAGQPVSPAPATEEPATPFAAEAFALPAIAESPPPPHDAGPFVDRLIGPEVLGRFLPPDRSGLPPNSLSLVSLAYRSGGIGGRHGLLRSGGFDVAELRGGWIEAVVRYDVWDADPAATAAAIATIQAAVLTGGLRLRREGVLHLQLVEVADGDRGAIAGWRKTADYRVLYEYRFQDTDGAASLIARIPVDSGTDMSLARALDVIHDWMVRWDDEGTPELVVRPAPRHTLRITGLLIAAFLPDGGPAGTVTQTIVQAGGTSTTTFPSLGDLIASFTTLDATLDLVHPPDPLAEGEVQEVRPFVVGRMSFSPPVILKGDGDRFRLRYDGADFPPGGRSQVYLRAVVEGDV